MRISILIVIVAAKILISSLLTTVAVKTLKDRHINIANYFPGSFQIDHVDSESLPPAQDGPPE